MIRDPCSRSTFGGLGIFGTPAHLADEMFAATSVRATHDTLNSRAHAHAHTRVARAEHITGHEVPDAVVLRPSSTGRAHFGTEHLDARSRARSIS